MEAGPNPSPTAAGGGAAADDDPVDAGEEADAEEAADVDAEEADVDAEAGAEEGADAEEAEGTNNAAPAPAAAAPARARARKPAAAPAPAPTQPVVLMAHQVAHAERLRAILAASPFAFDLSMLGAGKTYTASHIALTGGFRHVVVVAPLSVLPKWLHMRDAHGVPVRHAVSFCSLRSTKCHQPRHGLLHRRDFTRRMVLEGVERDVDVVQFAPTEALQRMAVEGLLLVLDEVQHVKNVSAQFRAARALIEAVAAAPAATHSRALLLSGSPVDKAEQVTTLCRAVGVMRSEELFQYNPATRVNEATGFEEVRAYTFGLVEKSRQPPAEWWRLARQAGRVADANSARKWIYSAFQSVIKVHRAAAMVAPTIAARVHKRTAHYQVRDDADAALLRRGVGALKSAVGFNEATGAVAGLRDNLQGVVRALTMIETAKIGTLARVAAEALEAHPQQKVVVCVNYTATLADLRTALAAHAPLVLDGSTPANRRADVLAAFQAPTTAHRLLLANLTVCATGIDLDDKHGGFPRLALVSPTYSAITLYQLGHRFLRADTRSDADVHFVVGAPAPEVAVLDALGRKGGVMKETTAEQEAAGVVFPGDHEAWHEPPPAAGAGAGVASGSSSGSSSGAGGSSSSSAGNRRFMPEAYAS